MSAEPFDNFNFQRQNHNEEMECCENDRRMQMITPGFGCCISCIWIIYFLLPASGQKKMKLYDTKIRFKQNKLTLWSKCWIFSGLCLGNICIATCNDDLVHCCNLSVGYSCFPIIANVGLLSKKSSIISSVFPLVSLLKGNEDPLRTRFFFWYWHFYTFVQSKCWKIYTVSENGLYSNPL